MVTTFELPTFMCGAPATVIRIANFDCEVDINSSGHDTGHAVRYTVNDPTGLVHVYSSGAGTEEATLLFTTEVDASAKPLLGLVTVLLNRGVVIFGELRRAAAEKGYISMPPADPEAKVTITITADEDVEVKRV